MIAVHARYRGRERRRAELVRRSAGALSTLPGVEDFEVCGVEDIRAAVSSPEAVLNVIMALLADGNWAVGLGISDTNDALPLATAAAGHRAGVVSVKVEGRGAGTDAEDIAAALALLGHLVHKRTFEGRQATALLRGGYNQNEAAEELGISKQAMSQRLQAAGWRAEQAGWKLVLNLIARAAAPSPAQ
ncbi:hypothetical protein CAPI_05515 [Corynebacterium capitovis DSM 44611]|uniref:hypothetical protein n=1 Tax=Corynebacterium capitovis TaxID=131081 RepID=UPI0004783C5C|nr:hypothetical protein [Corynebacterium capitovis]WKD57654.1 hypothetical protein CAPI_05515 [Corynebacterium capitovis DSM 44611]